MVVVYLERKVSAHMQDRLGPMHVGWHGILQPIADTIKLLTKEDVIPTAADRFLFILAPGILITVTLLMAIPIPLSAEWVGADLNLGLLYLFALAGFTVLGIFLAGWGSNNKYSLLGGIRSTAQLLSFEIPMILSVLGVIMLAGTLSMTELVEQQKHLWYVFAQPIAFLVFLIVIFAETNRTPFDIPEGESEIVAGFHTEYSGMRFALFFLAEYANMFIMCAVTVVVFLGGWQGIPGIPLPPVVWFIGKTYGLLLFMIWVRWSFPRLRVDQLMVFCWKILVPVTLVNITLTGIWMAWRVHA
ncbi:MAG: NADH-quinone oxidoreductase subunit NuoH [Nitrospirae bacterium]|nr:NADH-quinone oxidoreductase subunit NuoH [Nitrospirota bacterium]